MNINLLGRFNETQNNEKDVTFEEEQHQEYYPQKKNTDKKTKDEIPEAKKGPEKMNFKQASRTAEGEFIEEEDFTSSGEELSVARWKREHTTDRYVRLSQRNPKDYDIDTFKTTPIDEDAGVKALEAVPLNSDKSEIQSYLFSLDKGWTKEKAKAWLEKQRNAAIELSGAPYETIAQLPKNIQDEFSLDQQKKWMAIWNSAYKFYLKKFRGDKKKAEAMAFRTAYSKTQKLKKAQDQTLFQKAKLAMVLT